MQLTGIRAWAARSQAMYMIIAELEGNIEMLKANRDLTDSTENRKQSLAIQTELDRLTRDFDRMVAAFLVRMNARDRDHAYEKLTDMSVRMEALEKFYKAYRERVATYDFISAIDGFAKPVATKEPVEGEELNDEELDFTQMGKPDRSEVWAMVEESKANYEAQLALTDAIIPNTPQLIHA